MLFYSVIKIYVVFKTVLAHKRTHYKKSVGYQDNLTVWETNLNQRRSRQNWKKKLKYPRWDIVERNGKWNASALFLSVLCLHCIKSAFFTSSFFVIFAAFLRVSHFSPAEVNMLRCCDCFVTTLKSDFQFIYFSAAASKTIVHGCTCAAKKPIVDINTKK